MDTFLIAGLTFSFHYINDHYFKENFIPYRNISTGQPKYQFFSQISDDIQIPNNTFSKTMNPNTWFYDSDNIKMIYIENKAHQIMSLVTYEKITQVCTFLFNPRFIKRFSEMEYTLYGMHFMDIMLENSLLPIHASAINYKGNAILFSAPSQTGKSTQSHLWMKNLNHVSIINDDKPILFFNHNSIEVIGTPFSGKSTENQNMRTQLKAIIFIKQAKENRINLLSNDQKIHFLMKNIHRPIENQTWDRVLLQMEQLITQVEIIELEATMDPSVVHLTHQYLFGGLE